MWEMKGNFKSIVNHHSDPTNAQMYGVKGKPHYSQSTNLMVKEHPSPLPTIDAPPVIMSATRSNVVGGIKMRDFSGFLNRMNDVFQQYSKLLMDALICASRKELTNEFVVVRRQIKSLFIALTNLCKKVRMRSWSMDKYSTPDDCMSEDEKYITLLTPMIHLYKLMTLWRCIKHSMLGQQHVYIFTTCENVKFSRNTSIFLR